MTLADCVAKARQRLGNEAIPARVIEGWSKIALHRFAEDIAHSMNRADLERTDQLTLDGNGAVTVPADFLPDYISRITHASFTQPFIIVSDRDEFDYQFHNEFPMACMWAGKINTSPADSVQGTLTGDIFVTSVFVPTLTTLPSKYEDDFLDKLLEVAQEAAKMNPVGPDRKRQPVKQ